MNPKTPEWLLVFYIFLPVGDALAAQVLLHQVKAIHRTRRAEKQLNLALENDLTFDEDDKTPEEIENIEPLAGDDTGPNDTGLNENELNENELNENLKEFLVAFWLAPNNASAYAYLALFNPRLLWL